MILNLQNKTPSELKTLLESVKVSDAPFEVRQKNIQNIEKALRISLGNSEVIKDILAGQADIDDLKV